MGSLAVLDQPSLAALGTATGVVVVGSAGGSVAITGAEVAVATVVVGVELAAGWLAQPLPAVGTMVSASITS